MFTYLNASRTFYYLCHHYKIGSHLIVPEHGEEKGSLMTHICRQMIWHRCAQVLFLNLATNFSRDLCSARWVSQHFAQKRNRWLSFFSLVLTFTRRPAWPDFSPQSWIPGRISLDPRDLSNPLTFKCSNQLLGFPLKGSKFLCPNSKHYRPICPLSHLRNFESGKIIKNLAFEPREEKRSVSLPLSREMPLKHF